MKTKVVNQRRNKNKTKKMKIWMDTKCKIRGSKMRLKKRGEAKTTINW